MCRPKHTKKDANHREILDQCKELGMVVWDTADLGGEVLDALVFWRGKCVPVEIKPPGKEATLTEGERVGIDKLAQVGVNAVVVTCLEDVVEAFRERYVNPPMRTMDGRCRELLCSKAIARGALSSEVEGLPCYSRWCPKEEH